MFYSVQLINLANEWLMLLWQGDMSREPVLKLQGTSVASAVRAID